MENLYYSARKGIDLYPTYEQSIFIDKCIEGYRRTYNWSLQMEYDQYDLYMSGNSDRQFLSFIDLQNIFKSYRLTDELLSELPSHSMINAVRDMIKGYELFFNHKNLNNKPKFKTNYSSIVSYKPRSEKESFYFKENYIRIEGLKYQEMIKTAYYPEYQNIKYIDPIIFKNLRTGKYTLNFKIQLPKIYIPLNKECIGVDVNKYYMYACSNGIMIESPDLSRELKHLSDIDRNIAENRIRLKETNQISNTFQYKLEKRRKIYQHISNIYRNIAYNGSIQIINCNPVAMILEDLDIKSIMSHSYIADDLQFYPLGISQQILAEQSFKYNIPVFYAPKDYQSSNICSFCGEYKNIKDYDYFVCPKCGSRIQRDLNAAINLQKWFVENNNSLISPCIDFYRF